MTAVAVQHHRPVPGDVVEIDPGGQPTLGQSFVIETLPDDRALDPVGELGDPGHHVADVGGVHQLETGDHGGVPERMEMVVVVHQSNDGNDCVISDDRDEGVI